MKKKKSLKKIGKSKSHPRTKSLSTKKSTKSLKKSSKKDTPKKSKSRKPLSQTKPIKNLTARRKKFLAALKEDPTNIAKAGRVAGFSRHYAHLIIKEDPVLRSEFDTFLDVFNYEIPNELVARVIRRGLVAKKIEIAKHEGKMCEIRAFPDHSVRSRFADIAIRVKDKYPRPETFEQKTEIQADQVMIIYGDPNNTAKENTIRSPLRTSPYDPSKSHKTPSN